MIDKIKYKDHVHYVYYKTPQYWIISRHNQKKFMFSVLVIDLKLSLKQKKEQKQLEKDRLEEVINVETPPGEINFKYNKNGEIE